MKELRKDKLFRLKNDINYLVWLDDVLKVTAENLMSKGILK